MQISSEYDEENEEEQSEIGGKITPLGNKLIKIYLI